MKVLIAYDGSVSSDNAIVDLHRAGLPAQTEALVLTVAETTPMQVAIPFGALAAGPGIYVPEGVETEESTDHHLQEALGYADQAAQRLRADFPQWHATTEAWVDAAGPAIVRKARAWSPDLIVVGTHGRSGLMRMFLGSVSQSVLNHVPCSVRISRHRLHSQDREIRLVVGVDASPCSKTAVEAIATRNWPAGTLVRAVGVLDSRIALAAASTPSGAVPVAIEEESRAALDNAVRNAADILAKAGLQSTHEVVVGKPEHMLISLAEKWAADAIFVGARGKGAMERLLMGSVCASVAARAHCSVEVVRGNSACGCGAN